MNEWLYTSLPNRSEGLRMHLWLSRSCHVTGNERITTDEIAAIPHRIGDMSALIYLANGLEVRLNRKPA